MEQSQQLLARGSNYQLNLLCVHRGYYTVTRRYEFYVRVAEWQEQYLTSELVRYCFCHENIKFISSS